MNGVDTGKKSQHLISVINLHFRKLKAFKLEFGIFPHKNDAFTLLTKFPKSAVMNFEVNATFKISFQFIIFFWYPTPDCINSHAETSVVLLISFSNRFSSSGVLSLPSFNLY